MYSIKLTSGSSIWIHIFWISVKEREKRDCSICYYFLLEYFMQGKSLNLEFFYWYSWAFMKFLPIYISTHTKEKNRKKRKKKTVWYYNYYYSYLLKKICVHIALVKHAHGTEFTWRVLVAYVSLGSMSVQSEMKLFGEFDTVALKQHFGKKIMDLEDEKKTVQVR